jgi:hypothetical protein
MASDLKLAAGFYLFKGLTANDANVYCNGEPHQRRG